MRTILPAIIPVFLSAPAFAQQLWEAMGDSLSPAGISQTGVRSTEPVLRAAGSGRVGVAWKDGAVSKIYYRRWNPDSLAWEELGYSGSGNGVSTKFNGTCSYVDLVHDLDGNPVVAWTQSNGNNEIYAARWVPNPASPAQGTWMEMAGSYTGGGISQTTASSIQPVVALNPAGRCFIAWSESGKGLYLKVLEEERESWMELGGSATGTGISPGTVSALAIALTPAGRPVVAWAAGGMIFVREWTGLLWQDVGGELSGGGVDAGSYQPIELRVDPAGRPVVAWRDSGSGVGAIRLRRWNGAAWADLAGSGVGNGISGPLFEDEVVSHVCLTLDGDGSPVVAWKKDLQAAELDMGASLHARRWDPEAEAWKDLGSPVAPQMEASETPSIDFDPASGDLCIAWMEEEPGGPGNCDILVAAWKNQAPGLEALGQFRKDQATPIPQGGLTYGETGCWITVKVSDPDKDDIRVELELRTVGTPFSDDPTSVISVGPNAVVWIPQEDLALGLRYQWRLRAVDVRDNASPWTAYGQDSPDETDFWVRDNAAPTIAASFQYDSAGFPLSPGGSVYPLDPVFLAASGEDEDGDAFLVEVEVRETGETFSGVATGWDFIGVKVEPGEGDYHWQARLADSYGGRSGWMSFGGNAESEADFEVIALGSLGSGFCSNAATARIGGLLPLLLLGLRCLRKP